MFSGGIETGGRNWVKAINTVLNVIVNILGQLQTKKGYYGALLFHHDEGMNSQRFYLPKRKMQIGVTKLYFTISASFTKNIL